MTTLVDLVAAPVAKETRQYRIESAGVEPVLLDIELSVTINPQNAMAFASAINRAEKVSGKQVEHIAYVPPGITDEALLDRYSRKDVMDAAYMAF